MFIKEGDYLVCCKICRITYSISRNIGYVALRQLQFLELDLHKEEWYLDDGIHCFLF